MSRFSAFILVLLGLATSSSTAFPQNNYSSPESALRKELAYANAINAVLCSNGAHSNEVAQKFYACYDERIFRGANKFIGCQQRVFGVQLNSEQNIDQACKAGDIRPYALCLFTSLLAPPNATLPSTALHALNNCQGRVMGVERPQ